MKLKNKADTDNFPLLELIRKLTPKQQEVLGEVMIGQDNKQPKNTLDLLERKGLITSFIAPMGIKRYYMEYHQNYAYCCWCAEQNFSEEGS